MDEPVRTLEVGVPDIFGQRDVARPKAREPAPHWQLVYESHRPKLLMELIAEFLGVFIFCWAGEGAVTQWYLAQRTDNPTRGDNLTEAFTFAVAIALAVIVVGPVSGGHLSPSLTIVFVIFKGFPIWKLPLYVIAQLLGAWMASLMVYVQNIPALPQISKEMTEAGQYDLIFTTAGPASCIGVYPAPGWTKYGITFLNEFFSSMLVGLVVFSILDTSNGAGFIGLTFLIVLTAYGPNGVALNTARDLGSRFAVACIWKTTKAFPARWTAMMCLTNIAGVLVGTTLQTFLLADSSRPHTAPYVAATAAQEMAAQAHTERLQQRGEGGNISRAVSGGFQKMGRSMTTRRREKFGQTQHIEHQGEGGSDDSLNAPTAHEEGNGNSGNGESALQV